MINQLIKRKKLIIVAVLIIILGLFLFASVATNRLRVVSADPADNGEINTYSSVIITFNQGVTADNARIVFRPEVFYTKRVEGKLLIITPSLPFKNKTPYKLTVQNVCASDAAESCVDHTLVFSTDDTIPFDELSDQQQKIVIRETDAEYNESPILAILPVRETDFLIDAEPVGEFTYIIITPNVFGRTMSEAEYNAAYSKYYNAGREYLEGKGYELETSKYKVVSKSEYLKMW